GILGRRRARHPPGAKGGGGGDVQSRGGSGIVRQIVDRSIRRRDDPIGDEIDTRKVSGAQRAVAGRPVVDVPTNRVGGGASRQGGQRQRCQNAKNEGGVF